MALEECGATEREITGGETPGHEKENTDAVPYVSMENTNVEPCLNEVRTRAALANGFCLHGDAELRVWVSAVGRVPRGQEVSWADRALASQTGWLGSGCSGNIQLPSPSPPPSLTFMFNSCGHGLSDKGIGDFFYPDGETYPDVGWDPDGWRSKTIRDDGNFSIWLARSRSHVYLVTFATS